MIGLDAASLPFIRQHAQDLPRLRGLLREAVLHEFAVRPAAINGAVWPNFFTGTHPGWHGFYHDLAWDAARMRIRRVTEDRLPYSPFWHRFEACGLACIAIDVPHTFPPRPRRGVEIVNWNSHDHMAPFSTHPPELSREIIDRFGGRAIGYEIPSDRTSHQMEKIRRDLRESARRKGDLCAWLLAREPWDFFIAVFGELHRGGHQLWDRPTSGVNRPPARALLSVYRAIDDALRLMLEHLNQPDVCVLVFALNGMGDNYGQDHLMLEFMDRLNSEFWRREGRADLNGSPRPSLVRLLRAVVPSAIQQAIGQRSPIWLRDEIVNRTYTEGLNWERTPGFTVRGDLDTYIRFNLRGREARGLIEPGSDQLRRYREWLCECLHGLRDGRTGAKLVRDVHLTHELYSGPRSDRLPDVVVVYQDVPPTDHARSEQLGDFNLRCKIGRNGTHLPEGFCLARRPFPSIAREGAVTGPLDFAPLVLEHYGLARNGG
jgi:predicted AlkP superfamily phosphohydrolase/phosphomutase